MKLTNQIRKDFVDAVMKATPWKNTMTDELAIAEFEKRAFAMLPPDVKVVHKKYPGAIATDNRQVPQMPKNFVITDFKDPHRPLRRWWATIPVIISESQVEFEDIRKMVLDRDEEITKREGMRRQLSGVAYHATTFQELEAALPEFKQWLPKSPPKKSKTMALAPVGLVASFKKAGLPVAARGASK